MKIGPPKFWGVKTSILWSENLESAVFGQPLCGKEEKFWENSNNWYNYNISVTLPSTFGEIGLGEFEL